MELAAVAAAATIQSNFVLTLEQRAAVEAGRLEQQYQYHDRKRRHLGERRVDQ